MKPLPQDTEQTNLQENVMRKALLALFVVPLLTLPAFAGSLSAGDKPMIVAENVVVGVGPVGVGVGHRHRDHGDLYMSTRHRDHRDDRRDDRH
jgi:hypothetical protein